MSKIKLKRMIAVCMACLGMGVFAFAGCEGDITISTGGDDIVISGGNHGGNQGGENNGNQGGNTETPVNPEPDNPNPDTPVNPEPDNPDPDKPVNPNPENPDPDKPVNPEPDEPVIPPVPEGNVQITKASGNLESGYVTWTAVKGAAWYNVYVQPEGGSFTKLDGELVRQYKTYFRADAVGLKAGKYTMKVVPTATDGAESENLSATANFTVLAHERAGFAFVDGTSSGAYNEDGTLKANANVVYITESTKNTVSLNVTGATANPCVGLQEILNGYKKGKETKPLAIRLVGNITDLAVMDKGDIVIDAAKAGVTFEGIGSDATCNGWGLRLKGVSNVEVRNLGFMNCDSSEGDNIGLQQDNDHVWVHNCDLFYGHAGSDGDQAKGDGALDTKKSTYVTHSYNHFYDTGKSNLQNMHEKGDWRITYHHNWYDHSDSRHPRIRSATVHIYNNYFDGIAKYGVGATEGASAFVENNYFRSTARLRPMLSSMQGTDISVPNEKGEYKGTFSSENGGVIKSFGNKYDCPADKLALLVQSLTKNEDAGKGVDAWEATTKDEKVPSSFIAVKGGATYNNFDTASDMYEYEVDSPEVARDKVIKFAGRVDGGDFDWQFDNAKDDADYSVNTALKAALVGYTTELEKVGASSVSGGNQGGESGGNTGEEPGGDIGGELPGDVNKIEFVKGATYPAGITINGNYKDGGHLKMESSTKISITVSEAKTLVIHTNGPSKNIKINGTKTALDSNGEVRITLKAGETLEITKGDTMELEYILFE